MPRVDRTPDVFTGVPLLVPGPARAQSFPTEDRAPDISAAQPTAVACHPRSEWWRDRDYFDLLIADPYTPRVALTFPARIAEFQLGGTAERADASSVAAGTVNARLPVVAGVPVRAGRAVARTPGMGATSGRKRGGQR